MVPSFKIWKIRKRRERGGSGGGCQFQRVVEPHRDLLGPAQPEAAHHRGGDQLVGPEHRLPGVPGDPQLHPLPPDQVGRLMDLQHRPGG